MENAKPLVPTFPAITSARVRMYVPEEEMQVKVAIVHAAPLFSSRQADQLARTSKRRKSLPIALRKSVTGGIEFTFSSAIVYTTSTGSCSHESSFIE